MYGRNSDKGGDLTDVGASAIGRAINKEINLMDAGCRPLQSPSPEFFRPRKTKGQKYVGSSINFTSVLGDLLISRLTFDKSV